MSERSFFDRRQTLPGSIFLLVVVLYNAREVFLLNYTGQMIIGNGVQGVLIPLLTFFGSAPIGFLISEWWHIFFFIVYECVYIRLGLRPFKELNVKYVLNNNARDLHTVYNYLTSTSEKDIKTYLNRRWDLLNILGASIFSILFGHCVGTKIKHQISNMYTLDYVINNQVFTYSRCTQWECWLTIFLVITGIFMFISMLKILNHNFHMVLLTKVRDDIKM